MLYTPRIPALLLHVKNAIAAATARLPPCASCGSTELRAVPVYGDGDVYRCADCGTICEFFLASGSDVATLNDMANTNRSAGRGMTSRTTGAKKTAAKGRKATSTRKATTTRSRTRSST